MKITAIMCTQDVPHRPPKCQSWHLENLWHNCQASFYIKWRGVKQCRAQNGCCKKNGCRWELCGMVQSLKKKGEVKENRMMERGRAASQWISHSRPGLSAGGCARGEITGLLPRWSIHRHTANDRKLLAPGRLTDSPRHCLETAIFSFNHLPLTKINLHGDQTTTAQSFRPKVVITFHSTGNSSHILSGSF